MNGFAAFDSSRNWVVLLVPRAVLLLCTRCRKKPQEFLMYTILQITENSHCFHWFKTSQLQEV